MHVALYMRLHRQAQWLRILPCYAGRNLLHADEEADHTNVRVDMWLCRRRRRWWLSVVCASCAEGRAHLEGRCAVDIQCDSFIVLIVIDHVCCS